MTNIVVIAKECIPGRVKTRLYPDVTYEQAAELAAASLADTLAVAAALPAERHIIAYDGVIPPPHSEAFEIAPQSRGDLDERLATVFDTLTGPTFLIGMDTPQITAEDLKMVFPWPQGTDFILGLTPDGGFWGIGMKVPSGDLIRGVPMSKDNTGQVQLARLDETSKTVLLLSELTDVDTIVEAREVAALAPETLFAKTLGSIL